MTPYQEAGLNELSLFRVTKKVQTFQEGEIVWLLGDDSSLSPEFSSKGQAWHCLIDKDLEELPKDADGFYLWDGGECPVPGDWVVMFKIKDDSLRLNYEPSMASDLSWQHHTSPYDITAFKPISRPDMPSVAECATESKDSALDVQDGYEKLAAVLQCALDQAQGGKGAERHAQGQPFHEQPMQRISQLIGSRDGMAFQAIKKIQESQRFEEPERVINELLGAINYVAGMIIYLEDEALEQQENKQ